MDLNSKARGLGVFEGKKIGRLPMWYGGAPETTQNIVDYLGVKDLEQAMQKLGVDFRTARANYIGKPFKNNDDGSIDTIWGIRRKGYHYGQAINHPLANAKTLTEIESYSWPDVNDWDITYWAQQIDCNDQYCMVGGEWAPFFHDVSELFGMEQMFLLMYDNPVLVEAAIEKCVAFYYDISKKSFDLAGNKIDLFFFGNDFGTQKDLVCSPELWQKFFGKHIQRFIELGHAYHIKTALHSCGAIRKILPMLIDYGLDAINPIQVTAFDMEPCSLKTEFGHDLVFFGGIDENEILLHGTEQAVRNETRRIIDILGNDNRLIVAASHDYLLPEIPAENIVAMYDEARSYSAC